MRVLLLRATEYGNREVAGADARAGRAADHPWEDRKDAFGSISLSALTDAARESRAELERLLADSPELAGSLPPGFAAACERYVALLLAANVRMNLTRVVEPAAVARLHLLDALAALAILDAAAPRSAVDLGSGGGVPGLVLALARPEVHWTLVDSAAKKVDALDQFVTALGLTNATTRAERAETLGRDPAHRARYEAVTARACAALPVLAEYALPLMRPGGILVAWKGPLTVADDEVRAGQAATRQLGGGRLRIVDPGLPALGGHLFVVVAKEHATPARFPRRPGEPARRPLG